MFIYILESVHRASDNYHDGGSVVVVAEDRNHAEQLINATPFVEVTETDWEGVRFYPLEGPVKPEVIVFPDAGCC